MMTGTITDGRPHLNLLIKGATAQALAEFTVDTGFSGTFTLPLQDCTALGLPRVGERESFLADGSKIVLEMYRMIVVWNDTERKIEILAIGEERLLGAQILAGYELCLNYATNTLTIQSG